MAISLNGVIILARKHLGKGTMESSSRLCLQEAIKHAEDGDYVSAMERALKSLAYSVGKSHPDYIRASRGDGDWARQTGDPATDGVYGKCGKLLHCIIEQVHGVAVADIAMNSINYGGCSSFGLDILSAMQDAVEKAHDAAMADAETT